MTPRSSIVGRFAQLRFLRKFHWRALIFGCLIAACAILAYFPERYLATSSFTPTDREALGLSGTLGQLGAINSVFGNQAAVEVALRIGNSVAVRDLVIEKTGLETERPELSRVAIHRFLEEKVNVRSLRGGIVVVEMQDRNAELASKVVSAYQTAVEDELSNVSRRQTAYKRDVLMQLVRDAAADLATSQAAYDEFRVSNRYAEPRSSISAIGDRVPYLEEMIRANEVRLATARQVYTDNNLRVRQMQAELDTLKSQLASALSTTPSENQSVGDLVQNSSRLVALERDLEVARSLYFSYVRYLRGTAVEDLTSDANLRVLEPPHIETERQIWLPALAMAIAIALLWLAIEAFRLRPPPGATARATYDE